MDYRDERDALRGRVDVLEEELAAARKKLGDGSQQARVEQLLADLDRTQQEVARVRAELQSMRQPSGARAVVPVVIAGACALAGAGGFILLRRTTVPPPPPPQTKSLPRVTEAPTPPPVPAPAAAPASPGREVTSQWRGRVQRISGLPIAVGAPCTIRGAFKTDGAKAETREVEVVCGGKSLYRSTDALEGMSTYNMSIEEVPGERTGTFRHALIYDDQGTRSGARTQASINTRERVAAAWKDTVPAFRVDIESDELSSSGPDPIVESNRLREVAIRKVVERAGRITAVAGNPPLPAGTACVVSVRPAFDPQHDCRVRVRCGAVDLYGAGNSGFNKCSVAGGEPVSVKDPKFTFEDGDPAFEMDLAAGRVVVSEREKDGEGVLWSVTVGVDPARR